MHRSLQKLAEIYRDLDQALPRTQGNPCGNCFECCTAKGVDRQVVTELEFDYIAEFHGEKPTDDFRAFTSREKKPSGEIRWQVCPFYDSTARGCGIYLHRPFSCRVFGHFQIEGTDLPAVCVFRGKTKMVSPRGSYVEVPLAGQLRDTSRAYWSARKNQVIRHLSPANESPSSEASLLSDLDPVDRAYQAMARGDYQTAVEELSACLEDSEHTPFLLSLIGQSLMMQELFQEASEIYQQAVALAPESWELIYSLGVALLKLGHHQDAFRCFVQTIELNPMHALAWGFLGYMTMSDGLLAQAAVFFDNALSLDPENATFRMRLGLILLNLGYLNEARELLEGVSEMVAGDNVHAACRQALALLDTNW